MNVCMCTYCASTNVQRIVHGMDVHEHRLKIHVNHVEITRMCHGGWSTNSFSGSVLKLS